MPAVTCTRRLQFCAGHRVVGHENKCASLHGHNYVALITAEGMGELDEIGRVIDFSVLKARIGGWIDAHWDHALVCWEDDPLVPELERLGQKVATMPLNPTAENMAWYLLRKVCPAELKGLGILVTRVRVWETENCYADAYQP